MKVLLLLTGGVLCAADLGPAEQHANALKLHREGRYTEAYRLLTTAIEHASKIEPEERVTLLATLAVNYHARGQQENARHTFELAKSSLAKVPAPAAQTSSNLGAAAQAAGDLDQADSYYRDALAQIIRTHGAGDLQAASIQEKLGRIYQLRGQPHEAESLFARALATRRVALGAQDTELASPLIRLAEVHVTTGAFFDAEREARKSRWLGRDQAATSRGLHGSRQCPQAHPPIQ
jgi:tetratricopeptide (TPR) repeat protein